jgi:hypothetical protein
MLPTTVPMNGLWELPPLILHPFNERVPPSTLLESSKAALMLSGLMPGDGSDPDELKRRLLGGRYAEVRMLFFLGKDVARWVEQCQEFVEHTEDLQNLDIRLQSFAGLLIQQPPENVRSKLMTWGVSDYASVFARGIGLYSVFTEPPKFDQLTAQFLTSYHHYADAMYSCYIGLQPHRKIGSANFHFELYASGEYSRLLEEQWGGS